MTEGTGGDSQAAYGGWPGWPPRSQAPATPPTGGPPPSYPAPPAYALPGPLSVTLSGLGGILGGTSARPFLAGATVLLYSDTRMRREGLDLVLRSGEAGPLQARDAESIWRSPGPDAAAQSRPGPAAW